MIESLTKHIAKCQNVLVDRKNWPSVTMLKSVRKNAEFPNGYKLVEILRSLPVRRLEAQVPGLMDQIEEAPSEAFENYRDMAVANTVEEGSPSIKKLEPFC